MSTGIRTLRITSGPAIRTVGTRGRPTETIPQQRETRPWMEMDIRAIPEFPQVRRGDWCASWACVRLAGADRSGGRRRPVDVAVDAIDARRVVSRGRREARRT